jgi:hypothetical protein
MLTTMVIEQEALHMTSLITREFIVSFGKTKAEAEKLIKKAKVYESLVENPQGLHDSPYTWSLVILTENNDYETLDKYYFNN